LQFTDSLISIDNTNFNGIVNASITNTTALLNTFNIASSTYGIIINY